MPAGRFTLGSPPGEPGREAWDQGSESPATVVQIARPIALGKTAVTRGQFRLFVATTGYRSFGGCHTFDGRDWTLWAGVTWWTTDIEQDDDHPVVCIDHADAMAYIGWLNAIARGARYRLPSEAEREYAARAGTVTAYWWGDTISPERANYDASLPSPIASDPVANAPISEGSRHDIPRRAGTIPAAALAPNPWGLHNVHGNVWEWMADCYVPSYGDLPDTVVATGAARLDRGCDRRSLRGGAWNRAAHTLRAAYRTGLDPAFRGHSIGFRLARDWP